MSTPSAEPAEPPWVVPLGIALCLCSAAVAALIEVSLVPLYVGATIAPVTLVLTAATNVGLPVLVGRLAPSSYAAFLPVTVWIVCVVLLSMSRPEGDVLLPGGGAQGDVGLALLLVGAGCGVVTGVVLSTRRPSRAARPLFRSGSGTGSRGGARIRGR